MNFYRLVRPASKPKSVHSIHHALCPSFALNFDLVFSNFSLIPASHRSVSKDLSMVDHQFFEFELKIIDFSTSISANFSMNLCIFLNKKKDMKQGVLTNIDTTFIKMFCFNCGAIIILIHWFFQKLT